MEEVCFCFKGRKEYKILMSVILNSKIKLGFGILFFIFIFNRGCGDMVINLNGIKRNILKRYFFF